MTTVNPLAPFVFRYLVQDPEKGPELFFQEQFGVTLDEWQIKASQIGRASCRERV